MQLLFKKCTRKDLNQLVAISKKTFVEAFEEDNNPQDFKSYIEEAFNPSTIEKQLEKKDSIFNFVYKKETLVGYFKLNEKDAQTDIKSDDSIELERIYVLQEFQGDHIGTTILKKAIELGYKKGKSFIWLGVWQLNTHAVRFYEKHGFIKFGTHPYFIGKDKQTDWLMRYDLTNFQN